MLPLFTEASSTYDLALLCCIQRIKKAELKRATCYILHRGKRCQLFHNGLEMPNTPPTINLKKLGENIRFFRMGKSWTLSDLADASGISKAYISDLENGIAGKPNIQYVYSIACALDTTLDILLHGTVSEAAKSRKQNVDIDLPPGLAELRDELQLTESDVERLATIHFRGKRPRDKEGWRYLIRTLNMLGQHHG